MDRVFTLFLHVCSKPKNLTTCHTTQGKFPQNPREVHNPGAGHPTPHPRQRTIASPLPTSIAQEACCKKETKSNGVWREGGSIYTKGDAVVQMRRWVILWLDMMRRGMWVRVTFWCDIIENGKVWWEMWFLRMIIQYKYLLELDETRVLAALALDRFTNGSG